MDLPFMQTMLTTAPARFAQWLTALALVVLVEMAVFKWVKDSGMLQFNRTFQQEGRHMEKLKVQDLMVPTDRFPKISDSATFYQALSALETAQEKFLSGESEQRILLVENKEGEIVGKISPIDLFVGLETNYSRVNAEETVKRFGLSYIWRSMQKDYNLWEDPFKDLCRKASDVQVKRFLKTPTAGQSVSTQDTLAKCFHLFVMNRHDTLFVFEGNEMVGLLRFSDVYQKVSQTMKACGL